MLFLRITNVMAYQEKLRNKEIWFLYYGEKHLYYVDLSSGFNQNFIGSKTVISNDLNKLKFSGPTLLVIKKDKITKSYDKENDIVKLLSQK